MRIENLTLVGKHVRLEALDHRHLDGLVAAATVDASLYKWSPVPKDKAEATRYIDTALAGRDAGTAVPFATVRIEDGVVIGSTRFFDVERWAWPVGHARHGREAADVCEIGYTWLTRAAMRTAANTEAKLLMLTHAFESWQMLRVCLHTECAQPAIARRDRTDRREVRGDSPLASDGRGLHRSRFGSIFDRGGRVAGS
jgi:RimJ/RimL family protein N-acetyltransferase